jgi:murein L,D-transpeptidase YcbB/YkuD
VRQNYDAGARVRIPRSTTPVLSAQTLAATEEMIDRYRDIVSRGGWAPIRSGGDRMKVGAKGPAVTALRERLVQTGDLDPAAGSSPTYDSYVEAGVRRFQSRHGLNTTGAPEQFDHRGHERAGRAAPAAAGAQRRAPAAYSGSLGQRHVILNIPAAQVETVENGVVQTRHMAVVGKIDRQSPILNTKSRRSTFTPSGPRPPRSSRRTSSPRCGPSRTT